jgi:two-component system cell cycle sensor histidine kinase PleC
MENRGARRRPAPAASFETNWHWLARAAAGLHLVGLALIVTMGWHDPSLAGSATMGGLQAAHLAFLMTTGAAAAILTLGRSTSRPAAGEPEALQPAPGVDQLLAQMSHELRTPLNAMIGFSEVMLRELYGPLGNARYQEYAAQISKSGGQLLRSAEDALAITETMSAVMADRLAGRCERVAASALVREAWAGVGASDGTVRLSVSNCAACDVPCERRATSQALQHLLREAAARAPDGSTVEVRGRRRGGARSIEIRIVNGDNETAGAAASGPAAPRSEPYPAPGSSLRVILARLLVEMQGATLSLWEGDAGIWSACVAFPPRG